MAELTNFTIAELRDGFRSGEFTAREIAGAYNDATAAAKSLNAFTVETPDDALAAAEAADKARGSGELPSLAGIPLGIKDLFATKGVDTTAGSNILKGFKPPYESHVTANLRKAGAGMLGKLNMDEFAMGSS
ncbi:MAG: aspartyl-tRNA(Asn)/glutamyl-tRNA(Gln) amidotransferase subunit, partial [Sphingomonadales bacterium]|nr:aspartyl-tRNA(Asn)/glutamyl-tRNA(Gln) amidotransferase subunit [Sphingomonadales bacterium]